MFLIQISQHCNSEQGRARMTSSVETPWTSQPLSPDNKLEDIQLKTPRTTERAEATTLMYNNSGNNSTTKKQAQCRPAIETARPITNQTFSMLCV